MSYSQNRRSVLGKNVGMNLRIEIPGEYVHSCEELKKWLNGID